MCLSSPKPQVQQPVAPLAPLEAPRPMALADSQTSRKEKGGISQLRIASQAVLPASITTDPSLTIAGSAPKKA